MESNFFIRHADKNDISILRHLADEVWPVTYSDILTADQIKYMMEMMYSETALRNQLDQGISFLIIYRNDKPVGFASFDESEPGTYKLHKLYVLTSQQGTGAGKFMIEAIMNEIVKKGANKLTLNVNRNNKAINFYKKLGFRIIDSVDINIGNGFYMNDFLMEKAFLPIAYS